MTKMLKRALKWHKPDYLVLHLRKVCQIPFLDALTRVLLRVGQDRFGLIQEAVSVLQRWPQRRRGPQAFREELVQLL
jgi:hypothetical protein